MYKKIVSLVFLVHFFLLVLVLFKDDSSTQQKQSPLQITTHIKSPSIEVSKLISPTQVPKPISSSVETKKKPKNTVTPKEIAKNPKTPVTPPPQNKPDKNQQLLKLIQEELQSIETPVKKEKSHFTLSIPESFTDLSTPSQLATNLSIETDRYKEKVISYLYDQLQLPQKGKVTVFIEISKDGSLIKLNFLSSENKENEVYLKNQLPKLNFPCFNERVNKTYVISFCDE